MPRDARAGTGSLTGSVAGATPFISNVAAAYGGGTLESVSYQIVPKAGSYTRPLTTSYTAQYLISNGYLSANSTSFTIPVFGLYANYTNTVDITFYFTDGTHNLQSINISTAAYSDPCTDLNSPTLAQQSRTQTSDLNFDYFLLKDSCSTNDPAIVDTDGNFRWVGQSGVGVLASTLAYGGVYSSDGATGINRMELTTAQATKIGDYATTVYRGQTYTITTTNHHNIDPGRDGLIVDVNTTLETEASDLEFNPTTGAVLNFWDLGQIITYAMQQGGETPATIANFVTGTNSDWFHNNATTYNPADNTLIVSSRENFVIAVDYDTPADGQKKIHWVLGDTTKAWYQNFVSLRKYSLTLVNPANNLPAQTLPPIGQHGVSIDHNGNLLLFDDGANSINHTPAGVERSLSAVREYIINTSANTATQGPVYYEPTSNPSTINSYCGSAYDVKGAYLVDFPDVNNGSPLYLQGLGPSSNLVFNLNYPGDGPCNAGWNALPIQSNLFTFGTQATNFVPASSCRVLDTRTPSGAPYLSAGTVRAVDILHSSCGIPITATAYSLNVTVVPHTTLGYLTAYPTGQAPPTVSTLNSIDGRIKANAAIIPAGVNGEVSFSASNNTDLILDINGYFMPQTSNTGLDFYTMKDCRVSDTRNPNGTFGGPILAGQQTRDIPVQKSSCGVPSAAQAYSLNLTALPVSGSTNYYLQAWPVGQAQPATSALNAASTVVANAALVTGGTNGDMDVFSSQSTNLLIDISGYFAPQATNGLHFYAVAPCRAYDSRSTGNGAPFSGTLNVTLAGVCGVPANASSVALNATVVPSGVLSYLTLWPDGATQPGTSTLNAYDGAITSNMAIVPLGSGGAVSAFAQQSTQLILDVSGYFAP